ncbi:hypothetical protein [Microbacterium pumilum]|uniref:IcmF-related N-terminal domain-containing protein n=1 Tax=Microbacterium pumilum TaxID=344165 RepID=A0ABP5DPZ8_9MICO
MADHFWPDAKASIVLLPSGTQGDAIVALAGEWTKMGLLGHALWVMPEQVDDAQVGPPRIRAVVLGVGHDLEVAAIEVDLFEALARESLSVVRLVKLRSAVPSRELDAVQDAITERVREYVRKSMPMLNPAATILDQPTELHHATLICAPTEFQLRQRVDWASGEYGVVVVASPEDRSSPWSGDAFVRENERFVGFTLTHVASVAGLWNGVSTGSFELFHREESGHQSVWISRVFVNAVLTESLGRRTAAKVLESAAKPESLLVDPSMNRPPDGTTFIPDKLVDGYVDDMARGAMSLDDSALSFREPKFDPDPGKVRIGIWRQLGRFFSFAGEKLVRMPYWSWRWVTSRTSRRLTRALHTDEGAMIVGVQLDEIFDLRDRMLLTEAERIAEAEQAARAQAHASAGIAHVRTTPRLWARLRELVFGSLDGSADLSDLGFAPVEGSTPIFGRVSDVLALPDDPWTPARDEVPDGFPARVDWYALALDDPREKLDAWLADAAARRAEAETELTALQAEIRALRTVVRPVPPTEAAAGAPASVPPVAGAPSAPPTDAPPTRRQPVPAPVTFDQLLSTNEARLAAVDARRHEVENEFRRADADRTARAGTLERFDGWASAQDHSFIWRLLGKLSDERRAAERLSEKLSDEIDHIEVPAAGELLRLRQRFHRTMLVGWLVALLLGAIVVLGMLLVQREVERDPSFETGPWNFWLWLVMAVIVSAALLLTLIALIRYHAGWSRFERRIDVQRMRLVQLGRNSRQSRQEATRLASLHRQTVDWLVLLSRSIHRPWHVPEPWTQRQPYEVARGSMPFALQIATIQDDDHAATARLRAVMTDQLVVKGWRHAAFESLVRETAIERGSGSFGLNALDEDLPHASNHTRAMLLAALDDETILTRVAGPRLEELVKRAQRDELHGGRPQVIPVGDNPLQALMRASDPFDIGRGRMPWDEFLLGSLAGRRDPVTPLTAMVLDEFELGERHHERVTSYLVLPRRLESQLSFQPGVAVHIVPFADDGTAPVDISWRVDIAGPVPQSAIRLWAERGGTIASETQSPSGAQGPVDSGV